MLAVGWFDLCLLFSLLAHRFLLASLEVPSFTTWLATAAILAAVAASCGTIGFGSRFLALRRLPLTPKSIFLYGLLPLIAPSFVEESVYRALLLPNANEHVSQGVLIACVAFSLTLFVACHPLRYRLVPSRRNLTFTDPTFLIMATLLGSGCTVAFLVSSSLWPPVLIHYVCVVGWLLFLGGAQRLNGQSNQRLLDK